jgi:chemotaxis protein methyltransferase CheR
MVMFKRLNLMADTYPMKGLFDAVFCRNVMIYFNPESREKVVNAIYRYVKPGGYLFIGHSESLNRDTCPFEYVRPAVYRKGA